MKRMVSLLLALALCLGLTGCGGTAPRQKKTGTPSGTALRTPVYPEFPQWPRPSPLDRNGEKFFEAQQEYLRAVDEFREGGLPAALTDTLTDFAARSAPLAAAGLEGKNAVYSPASLWLALGMLARCTEGESRRQILDALGESGWDQFSRDTGLLWKNLYTDDGRSILRLANSVWLNSTPDGAYHEDALKDLAESCFAGTYAAPMGEAETDRLLSGWVEEQTGGLIVPEFRTSPDTLAILMSALYYKAGWVDEFDPERTSEDTFTGPGGAEIRADFMHRTEEGTFLMNDRYRAARKRNHLGTMTFILPENGLAPEELLRDPGFLKSLDFGGEEAAFGEVRWSMPKFDAECSLDLRGALRQMGVTDVLDPDRADLSALTDLDAFVNGVSQLTRVKAEEKGVEAAAVTIIDACESCAPAEEVRVCEMDLDRPFLFLLEVSGAPLFVGIINSPV